MPDLGRLVQRGAGRRAYHGRSRRLRRLARSAKAGTPMRFVTTKRIAVGCAIWVVLAGGVLTPLAAADPVPAPSPFSPRGLAGALGEAVSSLAHRHMESAYACVQVRLPGDDGRPAKPHARAVVRFLITSRARREDARRLLARATTDVTKGLRARHRHFTLPRTRIHVVNPRYRDRVQQRIVDRLLGGARRWIGVPGISSIPGISWGTPAGSENFLPSCPPVKIVLSPDHTADQLQWAQAKQHHYGGDRVSITLDAPPTGPPPVS